MSGANDDLSLSATTSQQLQPSRDQIVSRNESANASTPKPPPDRKSTASNHRHPDRPPVKRSAKVCRYYATQKGCRAGESCPYRHVQASETQIPQGHTPVNDTPQVSSGPPKEQVDTSTVRPAEPDGHVVRPTRQPVPKPVGSLQKTNPREFQIGQVVRRFAASRKDLQDGTAILKLKLPPSDPDFPFELAALECALTVPRLYPGESTRPVLKVENQDIPRGYQINIERGFDSLFSISKTLLGLLNDLDKKLESFLSAEKAQTIKIVANRSRQEITNSDTVASSANLHEPVVPSKDILKPTWTAQQKQLAKQKRDADIRQLEARMGRLQLFSASESGSVFNIPLQIPKPGRLPASLQPLKEVIVTVPASYNLEPCTIKLKGIIGTVANNVESNFEKHAASHSDMTLMAHVNHLTQHLHEMTADPTALITKTVDEARNESTNTVPAVEQVTPAHDLGEGVADQDRPHLVFIARPPPEWNRQDNEGHSETDSEYFESDSVSQDSEDDTNAGGATIPVLTASNMPEKGVLVSFPHLEMTGIELLELKTLSVSVRCDRCKDSLEIKNIKPAEADNTTLVHTESCNKCASSLSVSYRAEPMHANSIKAGYLDLEGCTILDMLPSSFFPTCAECSTTLPSPGMITVRGDTALAVCRECHQKMTVKIAEVKFLRVSQNDSRIHRALPPKRKKEDLGITTGTELPDRGRCKHYAKSYRWFRFSCCNRVYPCDRCHDTAEQHPNEHANRMICGLCSREQNYRPEDCGFCGRSVIRKTGGGFWEGGKGTRDRVKMNRNDPRKHKRIGGSAGGDSKKK